MFNHHCGQQQRERTIRILRQATSSVLTVILLICVPISSHAENQSAEEQRLEALVAEHLGIFVTVPKQRDPSERIDLKNGVLTIGFLTARKRDASSSICEAGRWLLTGRLSRTKGARALFRADSSVNRIRLEFLNLKTTVNPSAKGIYEQNRAVVRHLILEIGRTRAATLDPEVLERTLRGPRCEKLARNLLDTVWTANTTR